MDVKVEDDIRSYLNGTVCDRRRNYVTSVPSVTNVYNFFMNCRDAGRFVCCGFLYVIVCYGAAFGYAAAQFSVVPRTRAAALS